MNISEYYRGKRALIARQKEERELMLAAGIDSGSIQELHDADYKAWKADRVYWSHNEDPFEEGGRFMYEESFSNGAIKRIDGEKEGFLSLIDNKKLNQALRKLKPDELALIEACLLNGVSQVDFARQIGCTPQCVNMRLTRIKERIKKYLK